VQSQRPVLKQVQKLKMTPQLYQAVRLMALPLQDLKTTIEEELEKNPALQVEEDRSTVSLDSLPARESSALGDLLEGIVLHAFAQEPPFDDSTVAVIERLRQVYGLDLTAEDSHHLHSPDEEAEK